MPISFTYFIQKYKLCIAVYAQLNWIWNKNKEKNKKKNKNNKKYIMKARETDRKKKQRLNKCARRETGR